MISSSTDHSPVLIAAAGGQVDELTRLLGAGASVEATDSNGNTPLMVAANNGHAEAVGALLKHGANPNIRNYRGETALMLAAAAGQVAVVPSLIEAGADVHAKTWWGETAEAIARKKDRQELVELLQKQGSKITYGAPSRMGEMIVKDANHLVPDDGTRCWFCERTPFESEVSPPVTLFASMADHGGKQGEWSRLTVVVPMCQGCKKFNARLSGEVSRPEAFGMAIGGLIGLLGSLVLDHFLPLLEEEGKKGGEVVNIAGAIAHSIAVVIVEGGALLLIILAGTGMGVGLGFLVGRILKNRARRRSGIKGTSELAKYSLLQALVRDGWYVGEKPPAVAGPAPAGGPAAGVASSVPAESSPDATQPPATVASRSAPAPTTNAKSDQTAPILLPPISGAIEAGAAPKQKAMIGNVKILMALNPSAVALLRSKGGADTLLDDVCALLVQAGGPRQDLVVSSDRVTLSARARAWCQTTPIYKDQAGGIYVLFEKVDSKTRESEKLELLGMIDPRVYLALLSMKFGIPPEKVYI